MKRVNHTYTLSTRANDGGKELVQSLYLPKNSTQSTVRMIHLADGNWEIKEL